MTGEIVTQLKELVSVLSQPPFYYNRSFWNVVIVAITLGVLIWYTFETNTIAKRTKWGNLRPVILRVGYIEGWSHIKFEYNEENYTSGSPLNYIILKNLATNLNGYIVIDGFKHELLFGSQISASNNNSIINYSNTFGWINSSDYIRVIFKNNSSTSVKTSELNKIVINYCDIEGNKYHTIENESFKHFSQKGWL